MSYTYLLESGEVSSAECFSDIPQYVLSKLNLIAGKFYCNGRWMASCPPSRSGTILKHSTGSRGEDSLTLCAVGSPAKTLAHQEAEKDCRERKADSGEKWPESFAKFDLNSRSWKIRQLLLFEDLESSLEIWPKWGSMRNGECSELPMPSGLMEYRLSITNAIESSLRLPTPTVHGNYNRKGASKTSGDGLATALRRLPTPTASDNTVRLPPKRFRYTKTGVLRYLNPQGVESQCRLQQQIIPDGGPMNPEWVEWFMGWPIGMTGLLPLETDKFQQWLDSHGKH